MRKSKSIDVVFSIDEVFNRPDLPVFACYNIGCPFWFILVHFGCRVGVDVIYVTI